MGADRSTVGAIRVSHADIRAASGQASGALSYPVAVAATQKATGVRGEVHVWVPPVNAWALLVAGHALTVSIDTHATAGTKFATNHFLGGHSVFANHVVRANSTVIVKDPGRTTSPFEAWPWALLVKAAELRSGNRGMNLIVWPDTEGVTRLGVTGQFYAQPDGTSAKKGSVVPTRPYTVTGTTNGGGWPRAGGGTSKGWHKTSAGVFAPGKGLR
jgi:hypothetical protein